MRVVTLMWGTAWERYGQRFAGSFAAHWSPTIELVVVTDRELPLPCGRQIMLDSIPGVVEFKARWGTSPWASGLEPPFGAKVDERGYSWRFDALKWMPQALAPLAGAEGLGSGDTLVWLDADVITHAPISEAWINGLVGSADVAMLQRDGTHSEIGFYAMRMNQVCWNVLSRFAGYYRDESVFGLREWHSAFVFDQAIAAYRPRVRNLSPGGKGHVWPRSALAEKTVHLKGKRKDRR